jgi:hypothetical protein
MSKDDGNREALHCQYHNSGSRSGNGQVKHRNISNKGRRYGKERGNPFDPEN